MHHNRREDALSLAFLMIAVIGGWINAQGDWVKDFAYNRVVGLPLFAWNFTVSGMTWYKVGILDDFLGAGMMIFGLIMFRKHSGIDIAAIRSFKTAIPFLAIYVILDFIGYYLFSSYYYGNLSLTLYGDVWNTMLYFGMMPVLLLLCIIVLGASKDSFVRKNVSDD
ncbi:MAG: hypothetical protein M1327_01215 [Candidatus Thermoplasmatota archaeon]|nr:hypothetical protein [Candidatus Thermoplasmatota archaeon]